MGPVISLLSCSGKVILIARLSVPIACVLFFVVPDHFVSSSGRGCSMKSILKSILKSRFITLPSGL